MTFRSCLLLFAAATATLTLAACASSKAASSSGLPSRLSPALPYDVDVQKVRHLDGQGKIVEAQREFDTLAWQAFLALNWPANDKGEADTSKTLSDRTSPRVWQSWRLASSIFLANGERPQPWGGTGNALAEPVLTKTKAAWRQHTTSADENLEAFAGPLVDQNGKWVRYEVLVNREEFDFLFNNELYSQDGQVAFSQRAAGNQVDFPVNNGSKTHGAIEIKLAWKEMGANDDRSRFYTTKVKALTSEPNPQVKEIEAGLVGMHITMHTQSSPEWIWSTFEQVDNAPRSNDAQGQMMRHNFYSPPAPAVPNQLPTPTKTVNGTNIWYESQTTTPVQVVRTVVPPQGQLNPLDDAIGKSTAELNGVVQALLKNANSVFQYYELIGTQWPVHPNAPAFAGGNNSAPYSITHKTPGDMVPVFMVNTTMETYFMKGKQTAGALEQDDRLASAAPPIDSTMVTGTESCVGCHYSAGICIGFQKNDDGSYVLDSQGQRIPIYGENGHFGKTGNASFSWLLQIEAKSKPVPPSNVTGSK